MYQNLIKNYFCPIGSTAELVDFATKHAGLCRHNMSNHLHRKENSSAALQMFGFQSFGETAHHAKAFFTKVDAKFPAMFHEEKKMKLMPSNLTGTEQTLIAKMATQSFPHRTKCSMAIGASR